jgi:hypothetical protein
MMAFWSEKDIFDIQVSFEVFYCVYWSGVEAVAAD